MPNYSNKKTTHVTEKVSTASNRGMNFEHAVTSSFDYYLNQKKCLILKRPTPIHVVRVDYSNNARIKDAYFEKQSTADFNGVYQGKYIDFECKETKSKTSLPFHNIFKHQIKHLKNVIYFGGIAFFLIHFVTMGEVYLLDAEFLINEIETSNRKSIPYETIKSKGILIEQGFIPRLKILDAIDKVYFDEKTKTHC